jgi:hypothetical protein
MPRFFAILLTVPRNYDTRHNDTRHNDTHHKGPISDYHSELMDHLHW